MINRLRKLLRAMPFCVGLCLFMLPPSWLRAQPDFFNFSYNGPTTLPVGPTCSSMLQGNVPDPVVTSTMGFNITMSMFDPVASGFQYNDLFTVGTTAHVFWFVKDDAGHSHTYEYFITFVDNTPPVFDLTGVFSPMEYSSIVQVPVQTALPVSDNCTPVINQTFSQTPGPDTCESGTFTRTWVATDANNNTATYTQTIIIYKDTLPPLITGYPLNGSSSCEQLATAYPAWRALQIANFSATDASGIKSLLNDAPVSFPPGCKVPLTVKFRAIDHCNIQQIVSVVFTTSDAKGPVVIIPPKDTVAYCSLNDNEMVKLREWIGTKAYSQVFDSCSFPLTYTMKIGGVTKDSAQVVSSFLASFSGGCGTQTIGNQSYNKVHGLVSVDFFVKDACGNETFMGNADFGAIDTLPPVITGVNKTEQCGGGNDQTVLQAWINTHGSATVVDDCSDYTWTNFSYTTSSGQSGSGNFNVGPYPVVQSNNCTWFTDVTFRVTDDCGNSSTKTLRFSIIDTQAPTFIGLQPNVTVFCPNPLPTVPAATLSDNCDASVSVAFSRIYKDSLCDGSYTVLTTWTALDDCGNTASATQNIFVSDTTRPVFTLIPANKTFRCDTFVLPPVPVMGMNIMATDVCSQVVSITTATASFQNPDPAACGHYSYNIVRTFTATDSCGNTRTATQTLSVIDNLGPVAGGILDTTALCSALVPFPAPVPIPTDACSGLTDPPTYTGETITPGPCTDEYTITVHWTASDVCGNKSNFNQFVHVIDTVPPTLINIPPNVTVECDAIPDPPDTNTFNGADNCNNSVAVALVETEIRNPDPDTCEHWTDYILKREWIATDHCGNSQTYTQLIQIEDTTPPAIVPPAAMIFPTDPGECGADVTIPAPLSLIDVCSAQEIMVLIKDTMQMTISPEQPAFASADTIVFQWTLPNLPPMQPVVGNATLTIFVDQSDIESPQEYFAVYAENGILLGRTKRALQQCGSSDTLFTLTSSQMNNWLSDGMLTITLAPNNYAVNLLCNSLNRVRANLSYSYTNTDVPIALTYTLDGGTSQNFPPAGQTFLSTGPHTVVYTATDCAGNSGTSSVQITVNDTQAPSLIAPANITVFTGQNNCEGLVTLPFPAITENCAMSASLSLASAVMPLHFETHPDAGVIASDIIPTLTGIIPNAVGPGILTIRHKGDNAQPGEFFNVFDEFNNPLGTTNQGTTIGECSTFFETTIPVTAMQINAWAAGGGNTSFYLESNTDIFTYSDFISPCAPLLPDQTDGISQLQVTLEYSYAVVNYVVKKPVNQIVTSGTLTGNMTTVALPPANYTVMYMTTDNSGLTGMTSFGVTVRDTVKPKPICQPTLTIFANPAGLPFYTLLPAQINNGSTDNCTASGNLGFAVAPNTFNCNQAGSNFNVTLTVSDSSGNSASCTTIVRVENERPLLSYTPVCEGGTLQLFSTPPTAAPNTYTFNWSSPNGFSSTDEDPVVTNNAMAVHNNTYCVTITGATGCTSTACIVVNLAILGITPVLVSSNGVSFCPGQNVVLQTSSYNGINVSYQWLVDLPSGLTELGVTTDITTYTVTGLAPGTYTFYLKVFANGCNTALSNPVIVTVHPTPPADAEPEMTQKCEGEAISLMSPTPPTGGLMYEWTGPSGYSSMLQNPAITNSAVKPIHEGKYILRTKRNGCFSNPDTVMVNINPKPAKPSIGGNISACAGQTVTLVCNNLNASEYLWTIPSPSGPIDVTTTVNFLQIPNVGNQNEGCYSVIVFATGCYSDASDLICLVVHDIPVVTPSSNSPICQDSLLQLTASFSSEVPLTWCWTFPNGSLHFAQNLTVPNGASGIYQVVGKTSFGCADTATVTVTNVMPPSITFIGNNAPVCCDGTTAITLSANVVPPPQTYSWTGPAFGMTPSTLASPIIGPDANCTALNGQYTLVVKDAIGCPSSPATTGVNMQALPITPVLTVSQQPVCAGATVTLTFSNVTQDTTFLWDRPGSLSDTITATTTLTIPNAQPWHSGNYTVKAISSNGACQSAASNTVTVTVNPIPPTPVISSNSPVCQGDVLELYAPTIPGATYFWTGPSGFMSPLEDPTRPFVTSGMAGQYKLRVEVKNCTSSVDSTLVTVISKPATPTIALPPLRICIDRPPVGEFLNVLNPVNGMLYTWVHEATGIVLAGPSTASQLNLDSVLWLGPGTHMFRVFATTPLLAGCDSPLSLPVSVEFNIIPPDVNAFAGLDRFACADSIIALSAVQPSGGVTGMWSQIGGPLVTIANPSQPSTTFTGSDTVYTFQWSLSNGACTNFSRDTVVITAQYPEQANAGLDIRTCETTGIQLNATQGTTFPGMWTQDPNQAGFGIVIDDPSNPNTTISGDLLRGQVYPFFWEIGNPGCGFSSAVVRVFIYNIKPNAGSNQFICSNDGCAQLQASTLGTFEMGTWSSPGLEFTVNTPTSAEVCGLKPGKNTIYWTINGGVCGALSRDTLEIFYEIFPTAFDDTVMVDFGDTAHVRVLLNDILPTNFTVAITIPPVTGAIINTLGTGVYVYRPRSGFTGTEVMTYRICNTNCPDACSFATVTFQVGGAADCFIPTIITPNNDGFNDQFKIPEECTLGEGAANLDVAIFNQWGDVVFQAKPYLNDWGGTHNNEDLPAGTYYYVVKLNDTDKPYTGFLLIQR
ncbi:MAG: gliding motility-associated C-terminal domain-containing protein [Saprospiraceae bacterium]|nr:gliding motility-associated C-terminal domain-containing protein [Saprospiraceae bacterium]